MGKVVPIFKSGDRTNASNYRPITILPVLSTIIEKAVHMQLYTFLKENKLLAHEQFGFRPNLSTEVALAHLTDNILDNMDNGLVTGAVFLDLSKAFDTVDHQVWITIPWIGLSRISLLVNRSSRLEIASPVLSLSQLEYRRAVYLGHYCLSFTSMIFPIVSCTAKSSSMPMTH